MKLIIFCFTLLMGAVSCSYGQGIFWSPSLVNPANPVAQLYVDISSVDCDCFELSDADPETNPLYIWTWGPNEARPDIMVDGELTNTSNGMWSDSNENLKLTQDENNPNLWYFDFLGASLTDFYELLSKSCTRKVCLFF